MAERYKYLYGPVPSRRLGLSLGIDIMPVKICTLDCVYCQVGKTTDRTLQRKEYIHIKPIISELKQRLKEGLTADYITLSGSGEPTLNEGLGELIDVIKALTSIPVAVLTNGTLLTKPAVRLACSKADVVIPSLDAADQSTFQNINRPYKKLNIKDIIEGLVKFREQYFGQIWLEILLVQGLNTGSEQIENIKKAVKKICPDKIQLNTAVRPTAETDIKKLSKQELIDIAAEIGKDVEVIADFSDSLSTAGCQADIQNSFDPDILQTVLSILKRRPCTLKDISASASISQNLTSKCISELLQQEQILAEQKANKTFYKAK
ncbi:MAG: radical SAM protein [Planctomycetota bacterium]|jgi:wyosine [tRNA(Phe)-imidazoG37] synthetase (radical SAM superfamily)